ncbi:MAG: M28 family peptidase [Bacteroidales bacterium]|nr:M28 family peptidase [Bacteroidales bacterium]
MTKRLLSIAIAATLFFACNNNGNPTQVETTTDYTKVETPAFDADSAYNFVAQQLAFGPRIPNSQAHDKCAAYLANTMRQWCDTVIVQDFNATLWDNTKAKGKNIIASINPKAENRILLAAHWDSRAYADQESDKDKWHSPILGANDGASGVAVIMEIARAFHNNNINTGIDFIFFDLEDQGSPAFSDNYQSDTWCLGAQHWAINPHVPFYKAQYGILLDMVGGFKPRFTKEEVSMKFAPGITNKLWTIAQQLGYGNIFDNSQSDPILDDHMYINQNTSIPMVDIVCNQANHSFFEHWHTQGDNLDAIDRSTLAIVAKVVMTAILSNN